jgi:hypothetical protein
VEGRKNRNGFTFKALEYATTRWGFGVLALAGLQVGRRYPEYSRPRKDK